MNASLVDAILTALVLAYLYSAWFFMVQQKRGISFVTCIDNAILRGGCLFILGSGLSFIAVVHGDFQQVFI